jgi:hypothetical protein
VDGKDSLVVQLADEKHWVDLVIIVVVVCLFSILPSVVWMHFLVNLSSRHTNTCAHTHMYASIYACMVKKIYKGPGVAGVATHAHRS